MDGLSTRTSCSAKQRGVPQPAAVCCCGAVVLFVRRSAHLSCRWQPYSSKCKVCKSSLHQEAIYCQTCAYSKGLCAMCGKQILDTSSHKMSQA